MASPEQLVSWMGRIREEQPETILAGTRRAFEVTPAEKIRFQENARFGESVCDEFVALSRAREDFTTDQLAAFAASAEAKAPEAYQPLLHRAHEKLRTLIEARPTKEEMIGRLPEIYERIFNRPRSGRSIEDIIRSSIHDAYTPGTKQKRDLKPEFLDPERDLKISPFGAPILTIHADQETWDTRVIGASGAVGLKVSVGEEEKITRRAEPLPEAWKRLLILSTYAGDQPAEQTEVHEGVHDLYQQVFQELQSPRYPAEAMKKAFIGIKDEIIAYLSNHQWEYRIGALGNLGGQAQDTERFSIIWARLSDALYESHPTYNQEEFDQELFDTCNKEAKAFTRTVVPVCGQLFRLDWSKSQAADAALKKLLAAQDFKEMTYHLSQLDVQPLRVMPKIKEAGSLLHYGLCEEALRCLDFYALEAVDRAELGAEIQKEVDQLPADSTDPKIKTRRAGFEKLLKKYFPAA